MNQINSYSTMNKVFKKKESSVKIYSIKCSNSLYKKFHNNISFIYIKQY